MDDFLDLTIEVYVVEVGKTWQSVFNSAFVSFNNKHVRFPERVYIHKTAPEFSAHGLTVIRDPRFEAVDVIILAVK